ncbi:hypothetical protein CBW65_15910 [Tumebacillus avium]|uniref:Uncharacterized protein n=1 Tax=Tumebacillus avium TaxID=1903704 RepID=A0A1Y0IP38_9BACL|nr:hypothetical protein [Tumebacillus avium]ARU62311.1 hypothetical protein CBW65_15910 [Tumebacillus avium]
METNELSYDEKFLYTLQKHLESEGEGELVSLINPSTLKVNYTDTFTKIRWNQKIAVVEVKVPVGRKKALESLQYKLLGYCQDIFQETEDYALTGVKIGVLIDESVSQLASTSFSRLQVYLNLQDKARSTNLDIIEKAYLEEACKSAVGGCRLAAATMIGCAAEHLLLQLCQSYSQYLINNNLKVDNFRDKALNAKKASTRLTEFLKVVNSNVTMFESLGLENPIINFSFLDIIRQVRNDSGHPTGKIVSENDLNTIFGNYQLLIERIHPLLESLPKHKIS